MSVLQSRDRLLQRKKQSERGRAKSFFGHSGKHLTSRTGLSWLERAPLIISIVSSGRLQLHSHSLVALRYDIPTLPGLCPPHCGTARTGVPAVRVSFVCPGEADIYCSFTLSEQRFRLLSFARNDSYLSSQQRPLGLSGSCPSVLRSWNLAATKSPLDVKYGAVLSVYVLCVRPIPISYNWPSIVKLWKPKLGWTKLLVDKPSRQTKLRWTCSEQQKWLGSHYLHFTLKNYLQTR